jgi:DNA-binding HxlR family transcriptional regulator
LLIVCDLMFKDRRTYNNVLTGGEGSASNLLADRLRKLGDAGITEQRRGPQDARRLLHRLSPKGIDLAPVLVGLVVWSARHETTDAPPAVVRSRRADREGLVANVRQRWRGSV